MDNRYLQKIADLTLMDDDFMTRVFDNNIPAVKLALDIIIGTDLNVQSVVVQKVIKNLYGKEIWLDIFATDHTGAIYNIEIQQSDRGAGFKRARYHSSLMDAEALPKGSDTDAESLPKKYVIFITQNDVIGKGLPIYHIERVIQETGEEIDDDEHIIYVNGENDDESTALGKLIHDFKSKESDDMYYRELAEKVHYFKHDEKGVSEMCKAFEDVREEGKIEGKIEGEKLFASLISKLSKLGRFDDITKASDDVEARKAFYKEFNLA